MRKNHTFSNLVILGLVCIFGTGFTNYNDEKPEESIVAIISAIENNDGVAFIERVPREYWKDIVIMYRENPENPSFIWLKELFATGRKFVRVRSFELDEDTQSLAQIDTLVQSIEAMIAEGDFENFCRKHISPTLPFALNTLKTLTYEKNIPNAHENISLAVATMPDEQEGVVGMTFINKQWRIVSLGGNKKTAQDKTERVRKAIEQIPIQIVERRKRVDLYKSEIRPYIENKKKLFNEKKWKSLAFLEAKANYVSTMINTDSEIFSKTFQDELTVFILQNLIKHQNFLRYEYGTDSYFLSEKNYYLDNLEQGLYYTTSELIWKKDEIILVKHTNSSDIINMGIPNAIIPYKLWIENKVNLSERQEIYCIYYSNNNSLERIAMSYAIYAPSSNLPTTQNFLFNEIPANENLQELMINLAQLVKKTYKNAQDESVRIYNFVDNLVDAYENKKTDAFENSIDIATMLRDTGNIEQTAMNIAKNEHNNDDVKKFLKQVNTGIWEDTPFFGLGYRGIHLLSFEPLEVSIGVLENNKYLYSYKWILQRKHEQAPWKMIRKSEKVSDLSRQKDWNEQLMKQLPIARQQLALKQEIETEKRTPLVPASKTAESVTPTPLKNTNHPTHDEHKPTAPMPKKPGKAIIVPISTETMSLTAFAPDSDPDSAIRVLAHAQSPLIAVRVESIAGNASWKTKDVKGKALGVLAVIHEDDVLNKQDASFTLNVSSPTLLDLVLQDNGSLADEKVRMRVIFYHKDNSRTYSIIQR